MKKKKLLKKMIMGMIVLGLILMIGTGVVVGIILQEKMIDNYQNLAYSYTRTASKLIDGDVIKKYLETEQTDDYYNRINLFMNISAEEAGIKYFYVVVPTEEDLIYIWDAEPGDEPLSFLEHDAYSEGGEENTMRVLHGNGEEIFEFYLDEEWYVATAMSPLCDSSGKAVAVVGADISMPGIWEAFLSVLVPLLGSILLIMVAAMLIYYIRIRKQILIPITTLQNAGDELARNIETEKELEIPVHTNDELDDLARSYETMAGTIRNYIHENEVITAEKERIATELDLAARIQSDMLPTIFPPFPERSEIEIFASMTPAKEVGGDFYDFFFIDEDQLALVIADVSGKGIPAALFMMMSKILIQDYTMMKQSPAEVLKEVNRQICLNNNEEMFVTVWLGILNLKTGKLAAANAGHEYPIFKTPDGAFEVVKDKHGFVIGGMEGISYKEYELQMEAGAKLFVYTDGVPEATDADGEMYGIDRAVEVLNRTAKEEPEAIVAAIHEDVARFVGEAEQFDDLTVLCIEYKGANESS